MPELPDVEAYLSALRSLVQGRLLDRIRLSSPFVLRTVDPPIAECSGKRVHGLRRVGKRIVVELDGELFLVLHLMVAGRLRWEEVAGKKPGKIGLAAFEFPTGTLWLTEAGTKKRASLHVVRGREALAPHDPGGLEVLDSALAEFRERLLSENHTLKRALTDPRLFSGIGNAYSDEILHAARLSPILLTSKLTEDEIGRLYEATRATLRAWTDCLRERFVARFPGPGEVTAFRPEFAVHGKFRERCPACGTSVQRIRYAENETNYCPCCQTGGKLLADRALSRLLHDDWPKLIDEIDR